MTEISKNPNATELFEKEETEGTPFRVIHDTEKDIYFGIFGNYKVTDDLKTKEEVIFRLTPVTYDNIITLCSVIFDTLLKTTLNSK